MKTIGKIILISLLFGLPLQMCTSENSLGECNCGPIEGNFFDIKGIDLTNYKKTGEQSSAQVVENETVLFENYQGLNLSFQANYFSQHKKPTAIFNLTPSAYACSCAYNGQSGSKFEEFKSITITTINDFDENHLANSTINDLTIASVGALEAFYLNEYLENNLGLIQYQGLTLKIDRKPTLNENFKVKVRLELSTGEVYEKISSSVNLQ